MPAVYGGTLDVGRRGRSGRRGRRGREGRRGKDVGDVEDVEDVDVGDVEDVEDVEDVGCLGNIMEKRMSRMAPRHWRCCPFDKQSRVAERMARVMSSKVCSPSTSSS